MKKRESSLKFIEKGKKEERKKGGGKKKEEEVGKH